MLGHGRFGLAEALDRDDVYLVRALDETSRVPPRPERPDNSVDEHDDSRAYDGLSGWRRAQLEVSRLADEQAALRHVATLVAGQTTAEEIFASVAEAVARMLPADRGTVCRYEPDGTVTITAYWTGEDPAIPVGPPVDLERDSVAALVQQSGQPSRIDSDSSTVGAPILAEGRVWGAILATSTGPEPFAADTESRLMSFAELVATAISNAVARAELHASRARIVAAADESRRRIERNLHDGAQQRLATLAMELRASAGNSAAGPDELREELASAASAIALALDELREISRGIHPAILTKGGLPLALHALRRRSGIPIQLEISTSVRFTERIEVAAYYVVSELLTNAAKHARASAVHVTVEQVDDALRLSVRDDGVGGADPVGGSGLIGLLDRVEAIGGTIDVESPVGAGTAVFVSLPLH
jgi:signal transduction histidine kinase